MDSGTRRFVRDRADDTCEYCRLQQRHVELPHHIEHIVARQHGGPDNRGNLALECHRCNLHKGPNLSGIDRHTGEVATLFHPRHDHWADHFSIRGDLVGLTATGRATVDVLAMNDPRRAELRHEILQSN